MPFTVEDASVLHRAIDAAFSDEDFKESDHPRDKTGQFAEKAEAGGAGPSRLSTRKWNEVKEALRARGDLPGLAQREAQKLFQKPYMSLSSGEKDKVRLGLAKLLEPIGEGEHVKSTAELRAEKKAEKKAAKAKRDRVLEQHKLRVALETFGKKYNSLDKEEKKEVNKKLVAEGILKKGGYSLQPLGAKYGLAGIVGYGYKNKMARELFGKNHDELSTAEKRQVERQLRNRGIVRPVGIGEANDDEKALREAKVSSSKNLGGGVNSTKIVNLENGMKAVFKLPVAGEWAGGPKEEVGAWEIAKLVGLEDIVAPCVFREYEGQRGSLMKFWDGTVAARVLKEKQFDGDLDLHRAAAFDYVLGNKDRHDGNWMVSNEGRLQLIDNGFSFPVRPTKAPRGFLPEVINREEAWKYMKPGYKPPMSPADAAAKYKENLPKIEEALKRTGLSEEQLSGVRRRVDLLAAAKSWRELSAA